MPFQPLILDDKMLSRHCLTVGVSGYGKTNFSHILLEQQLLRGGGALVIDGKGSDETIRRFTSIVERHHRWQDLRLVNIANSKLSHAYNPLQRGDVSQVVNRLMLLVGNKEDSFFRSQAENGLRTIVSMIKSMNMPCTFSDILMLVSSVSAIENVLNSAKKDTREYRDFELFVQQIVEETPEGPKISERKRQFLFGDLVSRLALYCSGAAGEVLNAYNPETDLLTAIQENQLVYISVPLLSKREGGSDFGKLLLSDLLTAMEQVQNLPDSQRPKPPFMVLMDDFASYASEDALPLFEQAGAAGLCLFPFVQKTGALADAENGLNRGFADKILSTTWNKMIFRVEDMESHEDITRIAGAKRADAPARVATSADGNVSVLKGRASGSRTAPAISLEELQTLAPGEAFYIGQTNLCKVKVPEVRFGLESDVPDIPRFQMPAREGLHLAATDSALKSS